MTTFGYGRANAADGRVFPWVFPLGTTYWDQLAAMIAYLGQKEGGLDKLKGKKIVHPLSRLGLRQGADPGARCAGGEARLRADSRFPSRLRATTQESQWLQIRQAKPDYVILWGCGVMNPAALKTAAKYGYPARQDPRRLVGGLGRGRDSRRRRGEGLRERAVHGVGHQLPGDAGHQERRSTAPARATSRTRRAWATSTTRAASSTASSSSRRSARRRRNTARAR